MRRPFATLLLAASLATPAGAAPATAQEVVLTGSRSAHVEVTMPGRFKPRLGVFGADGVTVTTRGTYAGVWFESVTTPARLSQGAVVVPAIGDDLPVGWGGSDRDDFSLPAGRYRVHLLTDGASTVRVRVDGLSRGLRLVPRAPSDVRAKTVTVDAVRASIPVLVRPATTTVLIGFARNDPSVGNAVNICLDEGRQTPCETGSGYGISAALLMPGQWSKMAAAVFVYPGQASSGEHTASYTMASATPTAALLAFALSLR